MKKKIIAKKYKPCMQLGLLASTCLSMLFFTGSLYASTAANNIIRNTVTVDYDNAAGTAQTAITASVDITVNLVESAPVLSAPSNITTDPASNAVYTYILTSTANGPDTYNLSAAVTTETDISGTTVTTSVAALDLGATTVAAVITLNGGLTTITVPSDGANDASVNGLVAGDTVVIGGTAYAVDSVDDTNGGLPGTSTITINSNGDTTTSLSVGDIIGEQGTFDVTVTPGAPSANPATIEVTTTATDGNNPSTHDTTTSVAAISLTVTKFVANITNPVVGGGTTLTVDSGGGAGSITYYTSGVTGNPGDTLEYVIQVVNAAASSTATDVRISDPVPAFTTYTAGSIRLDPGTGTWAGALDGDADADAGEFGSNTVYIYVGNTPAGTDGAAGVGNGTGGNLDASTTTLGSFRVTIDN